MSKQVMSISIDEKLIGTLDTLTKQKSCSKSSLVQRLIEVGLKTEVELTPEQRYHFSRCVFANRCSDILKLHGIVEIEGGLCDKFGLIVALYPDLKSRKNRESRYAIYELSIYELLNELKEFDKELFDICVSILKRNRKLYKGYLYLYPR